MENNYNLFLEFLIFLKEEGERRYKNGNFKLMEVLQYCTIKFRKKYEDVFYDKIKQG